MEEAVQECTGGGCGVDDERVQGVDVVQAGLGQDGGPGQGRLGQETHTPVQECGWWRQVQEGWLPFLRDREGDPQRSGHQAGGLVGGGRGGRHRAGHGGDLDAVRVRTSPTGNCLNKRNLN